MSKETTFRILVEEDNTPFNEMLKVRMIDIRSMKEGLVAFHLEQHPGWDYSNFIGEAVNQFLRYQEDND